MTKEDAIRFLNEQKEFLLKGCFWEETRMNTNEAFDMAIEALKGDVPDTNVGDTISRQAAIDLVTDMEFMNNTAKGILRDRLRKLSSAEPERKTGRWRHYEGYLTCSECGTEYDDDIMTHCCDDVPKFCPNCGADMRGEGR